MNKKELIKKIISKREFREIPIRDIEGAFSHFDKENYTDSEKIKLTRDLLRKVYSAFIGRRILSSREKDSNWIMKHHVSTKERIPFYEEVYGRIFDGLDKFSLIDLGAGVNGFSYDFFESLGKKVNYVGAEAMGRLVELMNKFFKKNKLDAKAIHLSLFELKKVKELIEKQKRPRIVFMFKVIDSIEMIQRDYTKELLNGIAPIVDRVAVSFATKSFFKKRLFRVRRDWIINFIKGNFVMTDDFILGGERYIVFKKK